MMTLSLRYGKINRIRQLPSGDSLLTSAHRTIPLPDGRAIAIAEHGDADGVPFFFFHGLPGSRLQFHPDPGIAQGLGMRVVTCDRPGLGCSSHRPRRRLVDWPADVAAVAEALGMDRFGIIGLSGGGPYAMACAAHFGERVRSLTLISPLGPLDVPGNLRCMAPLPKLALTLARHAPWCLPLPGLVYQVAHRFPGLVRWARPMGGIAAVDRRLALDHPEIREMFSRDLGEALRHGLRGILAEARIAVRPWGFALESIKAPISLWYGDADALTPPPMEEYLARVLPACRVHRLPGEGHFLFYPHFREILAESRSLATS